MTQGMPSQRWSLTPVFAHLGRRSQAECAALGGSLLFRQRDRSTETCSGCLRCCAADEAAAEPGNGSPHQDAGENLAVSRFQNLHHKTPVPVFPSGCFDVDFRVIGAYADKRSNRLSANTDLTTCLAALRKRALYEFQNQVLAERAKVLAALLRIGASLSRIQSKNHRTKLPNGFRCLLQTCNNSGEPGGIRTHGLSLRRSE